MKYYVVSDVHGYCTYMKDALREAGFFEDTEECRLVVCGDLLDRGQEANELIEFMLQLMDEGKLIYIMGNHEELLVRCLQDISRGCIFDIAGGMSYHYHNRTWDTLLQISGMGVSEACTSPDELIMRVRNSPFYQKLMLIAQDFYETPNYIFTHGWIPCFTKGDRSDMKYIYNADWRNAFPSDWHLARWFNGIELACEHHITEPGKTIVCGHWHTSYGHCRIEHKGSEFESDADFSPFYADGIIAIDGMASRSKKVNCIVIED